MQKEKNMWEKNVLALVMRIVMRIKKILQRMGKPMKMSPQDYNLRFLTKIVRKIMPIFRSRKMNQEISFE